MTVSSHRVLTYPRALPTMAWLKHNLLWADGVDLLWPTYEPTPWSDNDQGVLEAIRSVREAQLDPLIATHGLHMFSVSDVDRLLSEYQPRSPAPRSGDLASQVDDPETFLYRSKFDPRVAHHLLDKGWAQSDGTEHGLVADPKFLARLLHAGAESVAAETGATLDPDNRVSEENALLGPRSRTAPAIEVCLPQLPTFAPNSVSINQILEWRSDSKFERLRSDYLTELDRALDWAAQTFDGAFTPVEAHRTLASEVQKDFGAAQLGFTEFWLGSAEVTSSMTEVAAVVVCMPPDSITDPTAFAPLVTPVLQLAFAIRGIPSRTRRQRLLRRIRKRLDGNLVLATVEN